MRYLPAPAGVLSAPIRHAISSRPSEHIRVQVSRVLVQCLQQGVRENSVPQALVLVTHLPVAAPVDHFHAPPPVNRRSDIACLRLPKRLASTRPTLLAPARVQDRQHFLIAEFSLPDPRDRVEWDGPQPSPLAVRRMQMILAAYLLAVSGKKKQENIPAADFAQETSFQGVPAGVRAQEKGRLEATAFPKRAIQLPRVRLGKSQLREPRVARVLIDSHNHCILAHIDRQSC